MQRFLPVVLKQILAKEQNQVPKTIHRYFKYRKKRLFKQPMNGTRHLYQKKIFTL